MEATLVSLKERYEQFKIENPKVRIRDAAQQLGSSEAGLLATSIGDTVTKLSGDFKELLKEVPKLGYVMALTRNDSCVHERKGEYKAVSFNGHVGLVLGEDIDLRLFMMHWKYGFAVNDKNKSLQFFGADGEAVHKIFLQESSNEEAYHEIVNQFKDELQDTEIVTEAVAKLPEELPDNEIDIENFRAEWLGLQDTHDFFPLLRKFNVAREQSLRLAPEGYAYKISVEQVKKAFQQASDTQLPIMVFVSSRGCIQIHTGEVNKLVEMGPWYNVLDPKFNLHLREDHIANAWVVKKPTADGIVTSIELFDEKKQQIALIFGKRKPGAPELEGWREIVGNL